MKGFDLIWRMRQKLQSRKKERNEFHFWGKVEFGLVWVQTKDEEDEEDDCVVCVVWWMSDS